VAFGGAPLFASSKRSKPRRFAYFLAEEIRALCIEANSAPNCAGLILWMHTFSPSKMWIGGLSVLCKPFLHLHTQFNRDLPWSEIDMDFMNLNQSAGSATPDGGWLRLWRRR
jgi:L-arabinose isomerase